METEKANQFSKFKKNVKEFLRLDEEVRILSKARSERAKTRDTLGKEIMNYYKINQINSIDLNTDDGTEQLELIESRRKPSVNQKFLRSALEAYCKNDQQIVDNMIEHILDKREESEVSTFRLKRVQPKSNKKKSDQATPEQKADIQRRFAMLTKFSLPTQKPNPEIEEKQEIHNNLEKLAQEIADSVLPTNNPIPEPEEEEIPVEEVPDEEVPDEEVIMEEIPEESFEEVPLKESKKPTELFKESSKEVKEEFSEDEDEVILDQIPVEETGCEDEKKPIISPEPVKPISHHIGERLDQMSEKEFAGAIPKPEPVIPFQHLETYALESWKYLDTLTKQKPILLEWLKLQKYKLTLIRNRSQYQLHDFKKLLIEVDQKEKQFLPLEPEIEKHRLLIKKYILRRFQNGS